MEHKEMVQLTDRKRTFIFINLVVSGTATSILSTAMTTALPSVVEYFGVSTSVGQWVTRGYSLAMGMVMPLTAFLITRFPTKKLYMTGIAGFILGILCSIFTKSFGIMTAVSASPAKTYGDQALMHGMNISFFWMAAGAVVLLLISVSGTRRKID